MVMSQHAAGTQTMLSVHDGSRVLLHLPVLLWTMLPVEDGYSLSCHLTLLVWLPSSLLDNHYLPKLTWTGHLEVLG